MTFSLLNPDMICLRQTRTPVAQASTLWSLLPSFCPLVAKKHPSALCTTAAPLLPLTTPKFHGSQALFSQLPGLFLLE